MTESNINLKGETTKKADNKQPQKELSLETPKESAKNTATAQKKTRPNPTRYGDWERNGRCIDF